MLKILSEFWESHTSPHLHAGCHHSEKMLHAIKGVTECLKVIEKELEGLECLYLKDMTEVACDMHCFIN